MFKKVSLKTKLISTLIFVIALIFLRSYHFYYLAFIFILIFSYLSKRFFYFIITAIMYLLYLFNPYTYFFFVLSKIVLFVIYILSLEKSFKEEEKEKLYLFFTKRDKVNFSKPRKRNYKEELKEDLDFENSLLEKHCLNLTESHELRKDLKEDRAVLIDKALKAKNIMNILRFSNYYEEEKKAQWTKLDYLYLGFHLIFLIIVFFIEK